MKPDAKMDIINEIKTTKSSTNAQVSFNTARILIELCLTQKIIIVADRPIIFLSTMRKHWLAFGRKLQRERASTFDKHKIKVISERLDYIYNVQFSSTNKEKAQVLVVPPSYDLSNADAFILICCRTQKNTVLQNVKLTQNDFIVLT
jgi:hypothetical protein